MEVLDNKSVTNDEIKADISGAIDSYISESYLSYSIIISFGYNNNYCFKIDPLIKVLSEH